MHYAVIINSKIELFLIEFNFSKFYINHYLFKVLG